MSTVTDPTLPLSAIATRRLGSLQWTPVRAVFVAPAGLSVVFSSEGAKQDTLRIHLGRRAADDGPWTGSHDPADPLFCWMSLRWGSLQSLLPRSSRSYAGLTAMRASPFCSPNRTPILRSNMHTK